MSELAIQVFLRGSGTIDERLADLKAFYGITAKRHPDYPNLVHFKYSQIDSPMSEQIVRECRGIILDEAENWRVVSRAFDKFFNYGEGHAATIDWKTAQVQEKVDGSLCVVYPYAGKWHVATTGTPNAGGHVNGTDRTFAEYFWDTLEIYGNPFEHMNAHSWDVCFYFELCGPDNRVVVVHEEPHLVLLGARQMPFEDFDEDGGEVSVEDAFDLLECAMLVQTHVRRFDLPKVGRFNLQSFEDIAESFERLSPLSTEGYVVVDANFNRVKVKHPGYVALHHAKNGMTEKAFIEICRRGETSEVLAAFPEFKPLMEKTQAKVDAYVAELEADFERLKHIEVQKDFALQATKTRNPAALFQVRAGKSKNIKSYVAEMRLENLREALG